MRCNRALGLGGFLSFRRVPWTLYLSSHRYDYVCHFMTMLECRVGSLQDLFPGNCAGFFNVKRNQQTCGWGRTGIEPGTLWLQSHYAMGPPPFVDLKLSLLWYKYKYSTTTHYFMSTKACFMPDLSPCTRKHSRPRSLESSPRTRWSGKRTRWRRCPRTRWSSTAESTSSAWVVIQYCRDYWQLAVKFGQYIFAKCC